MSEPAGVVVLTVQLIAPGLHEGASVSPGAYGELGGAAETPPATSRNVARNMNDSKNCFISKLYYIFCETPAAANKMCTPQYTNQEMVVGEIALSLQARTRVEKLTLPLYQAGSNVVQASEPALDGYSFI